MAKIQEPRGVNLGGWLIIEKWLTPSIFKDTAAEDEYGLSQTTEGRQRIRQHRRTFITEADFRWLHDNGVDFIRLPVGYWAVTDSDEYVSARKELDFAMEMAAKYKLKVLIDLHGVVGSQNGNDHSGRVGSATWFGKKDFRVQTLAALRTIALRYRDSPALWGIELLNEPVATGHFWKLVLFYRRAYRELRKIIRPGTYTVFHDGFQPFLFTGALWQRKNYPIAMDVHWYALPRMRMNFSRYITYSGLLRRAFIRYLQLWQPVVIGEWSTVLPQSFFNERSKDKHQQLLALNASMQQASYHYALGNCYWNYKAEGRGMWHFRSLVEDGAINT